MFIAKIMDSDSNLSSSNNNQAMNETENNIRNLQLTTNADSNLNISQPSTSDYDQNQSTNDNLLSTASTNSMLGNAHPSNDYFEFIFFFIETNSEDRRIRISYSRYQLSELEKEFSFTK
jgi:hypothetical protein